MVRRFVISILGVSTLVIAALLGWSSWNGNAWFGEHEEQSGVDLRDAPDLRSMSRSHRVSDRRKAKQLKAQYDATFAAVLSRNPGLEPQWKSVADGENGFLQWLIFCEKRRGGNEMASLKLPDGVRRMLNGEGHWDPETIRNYVEKNADLLGEITRIGLLPGQSTHEISPDRWVFLEANIAKQSADLLCADARLAAEDGDAKRALLRIRATMGLAAHHEQVETPTLIAATVSVLIKLTALDKTMKHILPVLEAEQGMYDEWRHVLVPVHHSEFSTILQGEFWGGMRGLVIPIISNNVGIMSEHDVPDPVALFDAIAQGYIHAISRVEESSYRDMWEKKGDSGWFPEAPVTLSDQSEEVYEMLNIGWRVYTKGWTRAAALYRRYDAAFAILDGREPKKELLTRSPFVYDPETRTLAFPDDPLLEGLDAGELKLP